AVEGVGSSAAGGRAAADVDAVVEEAVGAEELVDAVEAGGPRVGRDRAEGVRDAVAERDHVVAVDGRAARDTDAVDLGGRAGRGRGQPVDQVAGDDVRRAAGELDAGDDGRRG